MPPPTSSLKPGPAAKSNGAKTVAATATTPAPADSGAAGTEERKTVGKPDKTTYDAAQDALNKEIAEVKTKLVSRRGSGVGTGTGARVTFRRGTGMGTGRSGRETEVVLTRTRGVCRGEYLRQRQICVMGMCCRDSEGCSGDGGICSILSASKCIRHPPAPT
jgi:hypothetical protein